ncbi:hypothetical protein ABMA28_005363 [Loxostege sticticalis]|uniref:Integrase catalytic domain-containing protein n=1 Tax=Loxostege sticticalis TaxID=481309 RepID=A0ABD0SQ82_LOXSC
MTSHNEEVKSEPVKLKMPASEGSRSTRTSSVARRLEIEAARKRAAIEIEAINAAAEAAAKKAEIQKSLVNMELSAELAELDLEEKSIVSSREKVQDWLDKSIPCTEEPAKEEIAVCIAPQQRTDIQELAAALTEAISTVASKGQNGELLTRLATSKDLPVYHGDPLDWLQFRNAYFESTKLCKYTDTENMWRLRKCLRGEAKEAVSSLLIDCASPHDIIETLELRFGRPEIVMNKIVSQLKKIPPLSQTYHTELVQFSIKIKNYIAAASAIKQREYLHSPELVSIIVSKLPTLLVTKWADYAFGIDLSEKPKLECLSDFLYSEAKKVAAAGVSFIHSQPDNRRKPEYQRSSTNNVLLLTNDAEQKSEKCKFCKSITSHTLEKCLKFKRALRKDRWRFARIQKLCYRCLQSRHADISACTAPVCDVQGCELSHHPLLHWKKPDSQPEPAGDDEEPRDSETVNTTALQCNTVSKVLLKIVPVTLYGSKGSVHTHALLDDGSSVTLIASQLADEVGLRGQPFTMRAQSAWSTGDLVCQTEIVNFYIVNSDNKRFNLQARKIDKLNLPNQCLPSVDLSKYESTDCHINLCKCNAQPMLLIGQDNYDLIAPLVCIEGKSGEPYITKTRLGWCVHGPTYKGNIKSSARFSTQLCNLPCEPTLSVIACDCTDLERTTASRVAPRAPGSIPADECLGTLRGSSTCCLLTSTQCTNATLPQAQRLPTTVDCIDDITNDNMNSCLLKHDTYEQELLKLHELVRSFFSLEALGIMNKPRKNKDDLRAIEILDSTCSLKDGRWTVGLPWKSDVTAMPDSYDNAYTRLKSIIKKMAASDVYASRYEDRINHLFSNNYARAIEAGQTGERVWYLPHFGVDNPNKSKLRLVFDAAAKTQGRSLNDFLLQGPDLLNSLYGIMYRFREYPIAVVGDIKDMFLCIKIRDDDQHALRFLWKSSDSQTVREYAMTSLIFGANCSPFVAQYINQTKNAARFQDVMPSAVHAIQTSQYMDDYIDSLPDSDVAKNMVKEVSYIHEEGGFHMRNWMSNVPEILEYVPKEDLSENLEKNMISNSPERTLGLLWYPISDELAFDISLKRVPIDILNFTRIPTKREVLRIVMSIFDIHGFLAPLTIKGKILTQQTWKLNIKWDEQIGTSLFDCFREWVTQLQMIDKLRIPRWYFSASNRLEQYNATTPTRDYESVAASTTARTSHEDASPTGEYTGANETALELHIFCDASPLAYAAVAYWRKKYDNGKIVVSFIGSKNRVTPPSKSVTIPRLELQAALLGCRLAEGIKKEHRLEPGSIFYWSDSTTVLHWIRNESRNYKTFIANRLGEIDELSKICEWHYVPSEQNVADLATKITDFELNSDSVWFTGPQFLHEEPASWPEDPVKDIKIDDTILEKVNVVHEPNNNNIELLPVPDPSRFSSWLRLRRAAANVLLFIEKCRKKKLHQLNDELMHRGEKLLLRQAQAQSFLEEISCLKQGKQLKPDSRLRTLTPYLDKDGLLRVGGRIDAAKGVSDDVKSPVILDGRHETARLIVKEYHIQAGHAGNEQVVNELRQKYWLVRLRPTVRTVAAQCYICRIRKATPKPPRLGDLPEARLTHHQRPFTVCGVDLFGPIEVTVGRQKPLRYGVLFTCLTVRAIHIEIVSSLTADALIMALRRMAARRGWPKSIYSDNGTNMRGADKELRRAFQELDKEEVVLQAVNKGVDWRFIPPVSPHMGGAWERLIRSVKTALKVVLKQRSPKEEVLTTLLAEIENMVNSRPLTHVSVDPLSQEALTPNHFLLGSSSNLPQPGVFDDGDLYLRKQWRTSQRLADLFWSRWLKEVLPALLTRQRWQREGVQFKVGDLVVVVDPTSPRNHWPKGVVEVVYPGRDGRVRVVDVRTKTGVMKRPVTRVALLFGNECRKDDTRGEDVDDGS